MKMKRLKTVARKQVDLPGVERRLSDLEVEMDCYKAQLYLAKRLGQDLRKFGFTLTACNPDQMGFVHLGNPSASAADISATTKYITTGLKARWSRARVGSPIRKFVLTNGIGRVQATIVLSPDLAGNNLENVEQNDPAKWHINTTIGLS